MRLQSCLASIRRFPVRLAAVAAIFVGLYAGSAFGLYALMQPSVAPNPGLSAYQPPPGTVVNYAGLPTATSPAPRAAAPELERQPVVAVAPEPPAAPPAAEPKKETKKQAARTAPRRERAAQQGQDFGRRYASSPSQGFFRPWF